MPSHIGEEFITKTKCSVEYLSYSYLHTNGALFRCMEPSLVDCRKNRFLWIKGCYLLDNGQIVFDNDSQGRFLVFNQNLKGYVVLIEIDTMRIRYISRNLFFCSFNLFGANNQSEKLDDIEIYTFMLKAYHLQFSKTIRNS